MDNRTDVTEDQQSTPEHPPFQAKTGMAEPGQQTAAGAERPNGPGLTAGPHNDPPESRGIEDTYQPPQAPTGSASWWSGVRRSLTGSPMQLAVSALGVGLVLLAVRSLRSR